MSRIKRVIDGIYESSSLIRSWKNIDFGKINNRKKLRSLSDDDLLDLAAEIEGEIKKMQAANRYVSKQMYNSLSDVSNEIERRTSSWI